jgi:cell division septation protein DedD
MRFALLVALLAGAVVAACDRGREEPPLVERPAYQIDTSPDTGRVVVRPDAAPDTVPPPGAPAGRPAPPVAMNGAPAVAPGARLYTVQVAAFTEHATAQALEERLRRQGVPVWSSRARVGGREFTRVRVGATTSFAEAQRLGRRIRDQYRWPVWVARVDAADQPPGDAIAATRSYLDS